MNLRNPILAFTALAILSSGARPAHADTIISGLLYVADYGKSLLDRYQYTYDQTTHTITGVTPDGLGGNTTNAAFLGNANTPIKEGIQGTSDDLIVVVGAHSSTATTLQRYTLDGTYIGTIPVNFAAINNGNVGIGNVAITADGKYEYAPLETANEIIKIDLTNGNIVDTYAFTAAHDVAIAANGDVYAANYSATGAEVIRLDSNLNFIQNLVTTAPAGITGFRPTGLAISTTDGSIYVQDNTSGGDDSVLHYTLTNNAGTLTANYQAASSYVGSASNHALEFTFGNNLGPDGNLYIAALGGGGTGGFSTRKPYTDGIYEFNPTTDSVSQFIAGFTEGSGTNGPSGLTAPKYLQFDVNFVDAPDAGYQSPVPEPGTTALLLAGFAGLAVLRGGKRRIG